ncbi:tyrosine-type recombinase/integrase [Candidatus Pelagibacter sp.]|uniref:tyrosine-type recombinase/integrase n=1 Tax=Candidatus Pelagibacter sp. TaxID=2024849 RepID=UPI003F8677FE
MASYRKRNGKWSARVRLNKDKQISKTFILKEDAVKWARECEIKIQKGLIEDLNQADQITLKELLQRYKKDETIKKKGFKEEVYKIDKLCRQEIANIKLSKLTVLKIREFRDAWLLDHGPSSVNKYTTLISMAIKYGQQTLAIYLPKNPCEFIKRLREPEFKGEVIEPDEEKVLLEKAEHSKAKWLKLVIMLGLDCGIRRGEILKIRREDIDFNKHTVILRETKNGLSRRVGLSKRAIDEINKLPININGKLISCERGDTVDFYWQQLKKWTGINKRFHSTRHTFATRASMNGWSITEISAQGGWKDLKVLKRYTHISAEHLAKKLSN